MIKENKGWDTVYGSIILNKERIECPEEQSTNSVIQRNCFENSSFFEDLSKGNIYEGTLKRTTEFGWLENAHIVDLEPKQGDTERKFKEVLLTYEKNAKQFEAIYSD